MKTCYKAFIKPFRMHFTFQEIVTKLKKKNAPFFYSCWRKGEIIYNI